jgi:hypothetical protein
MAEAALRLLQQAGRSGDAIAQGRAHDVSAGLDIGFPDRRIASGFCLPDGWAAGSAEFAKNGYSRGDPSAAKSPA